MVNKWLRILHPKLQNFVVHVVLGRRSNVNLFRNVATGSLTTVPVTVKGHANGLPNSHCTNTRFLIYPATSKPNLWKSLPTRILFWFLWFYFLWACSLQIKCIMWTQSVVQFMPNNIWQPKMPAPGYSRRVQIFKILCRPNSSRAYNNWGWPVGSMVPGQHQAWVILTLLRREAVLFMNSSGTQIETKKKKKKKKILYIAT